MTRTCAALAILVVLAAAVVGGCREQLQPMLTAPAAHDDWPTTGGDSGKSHHSALSKINRSTVSRIGFAWEYPTHTTRGLEATPIIIDGVPLAFAPPPTSAAFRYGNQGRIIAFRLDDGATPKPAPRTD